MCGITHAKLHASRIKNGAAVRGPSFVDFYVISSLDIMPYNTVPIAIIYCFDTSLRAFPSDMGPIESVPRKSLPVRH